MRRDDRLTPIVVANDDASDARLAEPNAYFVIEGGLARDTVLASAQLAGRLECKIDALTEPVGVFVQHQMTLVAHQPWFDEATSKLGQERFHRLIDLVERRMALGGVVKRLTTSPTGGRGANQ